MIVAGLLISLIGIVGIRNVGTKIRGRLIGFIILTFLGLDLVLFGIILKL